MLYVSIILCLMALFILYTLSTRCNKPRPAMRKFRTWAYAHRGLHNQTRPENSLSAFRAAAAKEYGIELDVHLLKDGQLAVIHDSSLMRTTGAKGRIEDLASHDLWHYRLDGSYENIPTMTEVLDLVNGRVPLLIELKVVGVNYKDLCQAVCQQMEGYRGLYCIQSFDPRVVRWFRKNQPDVIRGQLVEGNCGAVSAFLRPVLSGQMLNFLTRPDFVAYKYAHRKRLSNRLIKKLWGATRFCWVVKSREEYQTAKKEGWVCIFEDFEP